MSGPRNRVYLADRGGEKVLGEFTGTVDLTWTRVRDDVSEAFVNVREPDKGCLRAMSLAHPVRHELLVMRDDEFVWGGPIMLPTWQGQAGRFKARDALFFTQRTVCKQKWSSAYIDEAHEDEFPETHISRAMRILTAEMAEWEDAGARFLVGVRPIETDDDSKTSRVTLAGSQYVWDDLEELAARSSLDYTMHGRSLLLHDTHVFHAQGRRLSDADFLAELEVSMYGVELAVRSYVTDGMGHVQSSSIGNADYYGPVELLASAYDATSPTQERVSNAILLEQARRNARSRYPVPTMLRVPENAQVRPDVVDALMPYLVPGTGFPVYSDSSAVAIEQVQKLDRVTVTESALGETVSVTLSPAPIGSAVEEGLLDG